MLLYVFKCNTPLSRVSYSPNFGTDLKKEQNNSGSFPLRH